MVEKNFLIAEAGINHNGNIKTALKLVDTAKKSGADAIKFQTYITEKRIKKNIKKSLISCLITTSTSIYSCRSQ